MADSILFLASFIAFGWLCVWSTRTPRSGGWWPFDMPDADDPAPPSAPPRRSRTERLTALRAGRSGVGTGRRPP
jgi:hypothetical protein